MPKCSVIQQSSNILDDKNCLTYFKTNQSTMYKSYKRKTCPLSKLIINKVKGDIIRNIKNAGS